MTLPFKPLIALVCSAGLFAASGVLYVKSRAPEAPAQATAPAPEKTQASDPAPVAKTTFTTAQIDQWVAPVALYPDSLLSQVLMASTYPANVVQAVQWSRDNPTLQGDAAIQAVASQPWDPSVKSLVAFPQLMALMGENPQWVQNLGDAFLAQPQDVMDAVQRLRLLAQQTGSLKSTPQQTVTSVPKSSASTAVTTTTTTSASTPVRQRHLRPSSKLNPQIRRWCTCRTIIPRRCMAPGPIPLIRRCIYRPLRGSSLPIVLLKVLVIVWASPPPMPCSAA